MQMWAVVLSAVFLVLFCCCCYVMSGVSHDTYTDTRLMRLET